MRTGRPHDRLDKLLPPPKLGRIVTVFPEHWSPNARMAYDQASLAGDTERQAAIILQETGEVMTIGVGSPVKVIEVRTLDYGPA